MINIFKVEVFPVCTCKVCHSIKTTWCMSNQSLISHFINLDNRNIFLIQSTANSRDNLVFILGEGAKKKKKKTCPLRTMIRLSDLRQKRNQGGKIAHFPLHIW